MTAFPMTVGDFAILMIGTVLVVVGLAIGAVLFELRRGTGRGRRMPAPGELDVMTGSVRPGTSGHPHGAPGTSEGDRAIAIGIAVDALAASQGIDHGHSHGHSAGHHDAGMHHGHDMSPPVHHDPGPATMPTTMPSDMPSHHHG